MSFSRSFDIIGRRLIGRYDETSVGFFPGLSIIMIFATTFNAENIKSA